jgi:hypothetical protein
MAYANLQNLSELLNEMLLSSSGASISELAEAAEQQMIGIQTADGVLTDRPSLENGILALINHLAQTAKIVPQPVSETENRILLLYQSGELGESGHEGRERDLFLDIKWIPITANLPMIRDFVL